jgi:hypothetical protein
VGRNGVRHGCGCPGGSMEGVTNGSFHKGKVEVRSRPRPGKVQGRRGNHARATQPPFLLDRVAQLLALQTGQVTNVQFINSSVRGLIEPLHSSCSSPRVVQIPVPWPCAAGSRWHAADGTLWMQFAPRAARRQVKLKVRRERQHLEAGPERHQTTKLGYSPSPHGSRGSFSRFGGWARRW